MRHGMPRACSINPSVSPPMPAPTTMTCIVPFHCVLRWQIASEYKHRSMGPASIGTRHDGQTRAAVADWPRAPGQIERNRLGQERADLVGGRPAREPPGQAHRAVRDVAIVGAGYTGLSAAITLARAGRHVQVLD